MKNKIYNYGFIIAIFFMFHNMVFAQIETSIEEFPKVTLERTEVRKLHSDIVGQDYEILISLPKSYSLQDTSYPVIFVLDPYRAFSMIKGCVDVFTSPYTIIPEVILVGIGYGGDESKTFLNWAVGRTRDLTPVKNSATEEYYENAIAKTGVEGIDIQTGGAPLFLDFIRNELFPYIESNYRIDTNIRILSGYSFGGLFGLYTLFHDPDMFSKYFIGSPSIVYKDGITFEYEINYANTNSDLKADVFMSAGELEVRTTENMKKMAELLLSRNYKNLNLKTVIFENENHVTCYPAAISRGLVELFNNNGE